MKYKNHMLLVSGNVISKFGSKVHEIVLNSWIISVSNTAILAGWLNGIIFIPILLFNLLSGYLADNYNKKRIIVLTDMISGVVCIIFGIFVNEAVINVPLVLIANITLSICFSLFSPSLRALVPQIISKESIKKTNAVLSNLSEIAKILAPAVTAYLLTFSFINVKILFILNGITFLLSSISEAFIDFRYIVKNKEKGSLNNVFIGIKEGLAYIKNNEVLYRIILLAMISNFFMAGYEIILPYYSNIILKQPELYGYALTFQALGAISASFILALSKDNSVQHKDMIKAAIPQGLSLGIAVLGGKIFLFISVFLFGYFLSKFNIIFFSFVQSTVDEKYLGRVFSVVFTVVSIFIPIGNIIFGYISEILKVYTFLFIGMGIFFSIFVLLPLRNKKPSLI